MDRFDRTRTFDSSAKPFTLDPTGNRASLNLKSSLFGSSVKKFAQLEDSSQAKIETIHASATSSRSEISMSAYNPGPLDQARNWLDSLLPSAYPDMQTKTALLEAGRAPIGTRYMIAATIHLPLESFRLPDLAYGIYRYLTLPGQIGWLSGLDRAMDEAYRVNISEPIDRKLQENWAVASQSVPYKHVHELTSEQNVIAGLPFILATSGIGGETSVLEGLAEINNLRNSALLAAKELQAAERAAFVLKYTPIVPAKTKIVHPNLGFTIEKKAFRVRSESVGNQ